MASSSACSRLLTTWLSSVRYVFRAPASNTWSPPAPPMTRIRPATSPSTTVKPRSSRRSERNRRLIARLTSGSALEVVAERGPVVQRDRLGAVVRWKHEPDAHVGRIARGALIAEDVRAGDSARDGFRRARPGPVRVALRPGTRGRAAVVGNTAEDRGGRVGAAARGAVDIGDDGEPRRGRVQHRLALTQLARQHLEHGSALLHLARPLGNRRLAPHHGD